MAMMALHAPCQRCSGLAGQEQQHQGSVKAASGLGRPAAGSEEEQAAGRGSMC